MKKRLLIISLLLGSLSTQAQESTTLNPEKEIGKVNGFLSKNVKLSGYVQFAYQYNDVKDANGVYDKFSTKLAMFILSGDITKDLSWMFQFEAASPRILEGYIQYKPSNYFQVKAGQMKTCFTLENQMSPSVYESANWDRVMAKTTGISGDIIGGHGGRDIGLQLGGEAVKMPFGGYLLDYRAGVFNGTGIITSGLGVKAEDNNTKDLALYLTAQPLKGLRIGASSYTGKAHVTLNNVLANYDRNRTALSAEYVNKRLTLRGEYLWGENGAADIKGFYTTGYYFIVPSRLALLAKYEEFEYPYEYTGNTRMYTAGATYHFAPKTRIMLNYVYYDQHNTNNTLKPMNEIICQFQIGF